MRYTPEKFNDLPETIKKLNPQEFDKATQSEEWSNAEIMILQNYYSTHETQASFDLEELTSMLPGRTKYAVAVKAGRIGLSTRSRPAGFETTRDKKKAAKAALAAMTPESKFEMLSKRRSEAIRKHGHPKGMLGRHHSEEMKKALSAKFVGRKVSRQTVERMLKTKHQKYGKTNPTGRNASWRCGWVSVGGKSFFARSMWEANYARYLEFLKQTTREITDWEHEPETFWFEALKRGCLSYLPDFKVITQSGVEFHEVKGWMDSRSRTTIRRMRIYHPSVKLVVIDTQRYKGIERTCSNIVPGWGDLPVRKTNLKAH